MRTVELSWKEFNVNLEMVQAHMKSLDSSCCGMSGNSKLEVHFTNDEISQEIIDSAVAYWDAIDEESEEAISYKTAAQIKSERDTEIAAQKASAKTKFLNMGLTEAEANAILGG